MTNDRNIIVNCERWKRPAEGGIHAVNVLPANTVCHNVDSSPLLVMANDLRPPQLIRRFTAPVYIFNIVTPLRAGAFLSSLCVHCSLGGRQPHPMSCMRLGFGGSQRGDKCSPHAQKHTHTNTSI